MPSFFVVHTQPNCEQRAERDLRSQSCDVYFPQILKRVIHARQVRFHPRPLFPRYLFVADDGRGVSFIKRSYGVQDIVRNGLEPARAPQSVINAIMRREDGDGFVQLDDEQRPEHLRNGERVRVNSGAFMDMHGVFLQMRGETRALIFLAGLFRTELALNEVERAA